jgi:transcriptional regulator with XRE-family HTH domain
MMFAFDMSAEKTKPLTAQERAECLKVKALYEANKRRLDMTQEKLGQLMGISQGAVSHYFNARARMSDLTLVRFAGHLDFDAETVRPGVISRLPAILSADSTSDLSRRLVSAIEQLSDADQAAVLSIVTRLREKAE